MITIYGRRGAGPVMVRRCTISIASRFWRQFFIPVLKATEDNPLVVTERGQTFTVWSR